MTQPGPSWPSSGAWRGQQPHSQWPSAAPDSGAPHPDSQNLGGPPGPQPWMPSSAPARAGEHTPLVVGLLGILAMLATVIVVYVQYLQW